MKLYELLEANYNAKSFFGDDKGAYELAIKKGKKLTAFLKQNCKPWLSQTKNGIHFVYRGFYSNPNEIAFLKKVRKDRDPKDSHEWEHKAFNQLIKLGGGKANRSNSVFAIGDEYVADNYGQVYVVLPIGKFNYTWHAEEDDWTGQVNWADLLRTKQTKKQKSKAEILKKEEVIQAKIDWEKGNAEYTKKLAAAKPKINAFFSQFGMTTVPPSKWQVYLTSIESILNDDDGSFAGSAKTKFKNVSKNKTPYTTGWFDGGMPVNLKGLVGLYNALAKMKQPEREQTRKKLLQIRNVLAKASYSVQWLKQWNKKKDAFVKSMTANDSVGYGELPDTSWHPKKHKPGQVDVSHDDLKRWLKHLNADRNLIAGIKSEHEIMISSNQVIAIEEEFYTHIVIPMLAGKTPKFSNFIANKLLNPWGGDDDY